VAIIMLISELPVFRISNKLTINMVVHISAWSYKTDFFPFFAATMEI
jgi:hypothetical protein